MHTVCGAEAKQGEDGDDGQRRRRRSPLRDPNSHGGGDEHIRQGANSSSIAATPCWTQTCCIHRHHIHIAARNDEPRCRPPASSCARRHGQRNGQSPRQQQQRWQLGVSALVLVVVAILLLACWNRLPHHPDPRDGVKADKGAPLDVDVRCTPRRVAVVAPRCCCCCAPTLDEHRVLHLLPRHCFLPVEDGAGAHPPQPG